MNHFSPINPLFSYNCFLDLVFCEFFFAFGKQFSHFDDLKYGLRFSDLCLLLNYSNHMFAVCIYLVIFLSFASIWNLTFWLPLTHNYASVLWILFIQFKYVHFDNVGGVKDWGFFCRNFIEILVYKNLGG